MALLLGFAVMLVSCHSPARRPAVPAAPTASAAAHPWFYLESAGPEALPVRLPQSGVTLAVAPEPFLRESDIADVALDTSGLGPALVFTFTPAGVRKLSSALENTAGRRLVLTVNAVPVGARRMHEVPADGRIAIFVEEPEAGIPRLVGDLKSTAAGWQRVFARQ